ncbi:MAG: hypothetical protein ACFCGT_16400 [Sandaracinaceae bacterium]
MARGQLAFPFAQAAPKCAIAPSRDQVPRVARPSPPPVGRAEAAPLTALGLQRRLRDGLGVPLRVVLTDNQRSMISSRVRDGRLVVRIHRLFLHSDGRVVETLVRYLRDADREASGELSRFIEKHRDRIRRRTRRVVLRPRGRVHDLEALLEEVRRAHVPDAEDPVRITWARRGTSVAGARRRTLRLGTYVHDLRLIRIHPVLDQSFVPAFFVAFVVFHELLHHVVPPTRDRGGRYEYHPPAFRARERSHPEWRAAEAWERANLARLLRSR